MFTYTMQSADCKVPMHQRQTLLNKPRHFKSLEYRLVEYWDEVNSVRVVPDSREILIASIKCTINACSISQTDPYALMHQVTD